MKNFKLFLPLTLVGITVGGGLLLIVPPPTTVTRLALCGGVVCGVVYGWCFWANRLGHLSANRMVVTLVCLTAVPATIFALVRVPYAATLLGAGFLLSTTTSIALAGSLMDLLSVEVPKRDDPRRAA